jgi:hypothetical protein
MPGNVRGVGAAVVALGICMVAPANAAGPIKTAIALVDSAGFTAVSEVRTVTGAVIDTFRSGDVTVRVIGWPGSTVRMSKKATASPGRAVVTVDLGARGAKTRADAGRYEASGRTVMGDLVALGADPGWAAEEFGEMDVLDPEASTQAAKLVSTRSPTAQEVRDRAAAPASTAYSNQCAAISAGGGEIEGYGCSTLFLVSSPSTGDWWFNNRYKFSVHATQPTNLQCVLFAPIGCPWRVVKAGWSIQWAAGNLVYGWEPFSAISKSSCSDTTLSAEYRGVRISYTTAICPDKMQPWNLARTRSGSEWVGIERGTDYVATFGLQALHSPPGAPVSYNSPMSLVIARLNS